MKKEKKSFKILEDAALPTKEQKEKMLEHILIEYRKYETSSVGKLYKLIAVYPWRFAFAVSALQTMVCAAIWGTGYTNAVLRVFGGS
ncbi:MAG: hypothetical protein ACOX3Q_10595 [Clostridia bacterium]